MLDYDNIYNNFYEDEEESYPDFFIEWDNAVRRGKSPGYYEPEELTEIIEIYLAESDYKKAKQAIEYALKLYVTDEDLLYEIFLLLNDYEQWNDLLALCERYKKTSDVWGDGHRLTALLHLRMEEDAFHFFATLKDKYAENEEALNIIYQVMSEALFEMDLFESSIEVINEAIEIMGENIDFYWLQLQSYASLHENDEVFKIADKIQKMDPLNAESWYRLGVAFQEINDLEKAIDSFEYAHSLDSTSGNNILSLVYAYERNGNYDKALERIREFLRLYPDNYIVNILASKICSQVENWEEALKYINDAIKLAPAMDSLYLYKSSFFLHLEEYRKAKLTLEEGIEQTDDPEGDLTKELSRLNEEYPNF
ncbi:MAG: tetratricopeptide repeat protein [Dysgonamonadaceae bacterium]|jgi:tetratricopeptide (TPR) repeat protein|nr:tetratricopeptide repeat protein [Dysgonamonadaceae bacterium]